MNNADKDMALKCLKIGLFAALGFWACGPLGAIIGLVVAISKVGQ